MAGLDFFLMAIVTFVVVSAAPSEISTKNQRTALNTADTETNSHFAEALTDSDEHAKSPRQKRWYNFHGFGVPPMNPIVYPNQYQNQPTAFAPPDPFQQIHNRIRDLTAQISELRPHTTFFPVLFIPQFINCGCSSTNPTSKPQPDGNGTSPDIENRFPEMDDPRQNWGVVINNSVVDNTDYSSRPIDLEPYVPDTPLSRPPPPVEHGSVQAGLGGVGTPSMSPAAAAAAPLRPSTPQIPKEMTTQGPRMPPTSCDSAVLTCCHRPQVTIECFTEQGCRDVSAYGNPCDPQVILRIVERFQMFYGRSAG